MLTPPIAIIPKPVRAVPRDGVFRLARATVVVAAGEAAGEAWALTEGLARVFGERQDIVQTAAGAPANAIELRLAEELVGLGREGYRLEVGPTRVLIDAAASPGLFHGITTLLQMLPPAPGSADSEYDIPCVNMEDRPRFPWRGAMLDVARHFFPPAFVKRFIDLLALHKLNTLHLHLTDEHGWRIEIRRYPKLTSVGASRSETIVGRHDIPEEDRRYDGMPYGGCYTQDEMRAIVAYAARRHISVVPEIDLPGHTRAAIAAYPELGCTGRPAEVRTCWGRGDDILNPSEETFTFLEGVFAEAMDVFPSPFIHVGGDEVIKSIWTESARCRERMAELGLADEDALQAYFIRRMRDFLAVHGRRLIGWDEVLEGGLPSDSAVMTWHGADVAVRAAQAGHDVVMAPYSHTYLDFYQSQDKDGEPPALGGFLPLETVYAFEPVPAGLDPVAAAHILGAQGQLWTEYIPTAAQAEYMAFPRLCALAEVCWSPSAAVSGRTYEEFMLRLSEHLRRLDALGVNYRPLDG